MAEESSRSWKDQYMLRLPDGMRDRIKAASEASGRSMNQEIVRVLEAAFPEPKAKADEIIREYMYLAGIALAEDTPPGTRSKAVTRMNELHRLYQDLTGERL